MKTRFDRKTWTWKPADQVKEDGMDQEEGRLNLPGLRSEGGSSRICSGATPSALPQGAEGQPELALSEPPAPKDERPALARPPTHEQHIRELLGLPGEWCWCTMQREGEYPDYWGVTLEGGIAPPKERGKYKGRPDWKRAEMVRKYTLTDDQHDAWLARWESDEGKCHKCAGTGQAWAGWHHERGTSYRPCRRCGATGRPPPPDAAAQPRTETGGQDTSGRNP